MGTPAVAVDFEVDRPAVHRLRLADGTKLEVRYEVTRVLAVGNDPATGFPAYSLSFAPFIRLVEANRK